MAPEMRKEQHYLAEAATVFALGASLYEMVTGRDIERRTSNLEHVRLEARGQFSPSPYPPVALRPSGFSTPLTRVSHIMPALNLALNVDFEKKALKKHYWVLVEHYLHFSVLKRLEDWWKPEISWTIATACCEKLFSAQVLCSVTVWLVLADHCCWSKLTRSMLLHYLYVSIQ